MTSLPDFDATGPDDEALAAAKRAARRAARPVRASAALAGQQAADLLAKRLAGIIDDLPGVAGVSGGAGRVIAGYAAFGDELAVEPALGRLAERGLRTALPAIVTRAAPLIFRSWRAGDRLQQGAYGIMEPDAAAELLRPDILLVPLLAFDREGYRLGYGGGFYDRTLAALGLDGGPLPLAIGIAYSAQGVEALPRGVYDRRLDLVVTPEGVPVDNRVPHRA